MPKPLPKLQRVAAYALILRDDRILLTRLASRISADEKWHLPGGGVDHGENPRDALVREIREETGLDAEVGDTARVYSAHLPSMWRQGRRWDYQALRIVYDAWVPADAPEPRVVEVDGSTVDVDWHPVADVLSGALPVTDIVTEALAEHEPFRLQRVAVYALIRRDDDVLLTRISRARGATPARGRSPAAGSTTASRPATRSPARCARSVASSAGRRPARRPRHALPAGPRPPVASRTSTGCTWSSAARSPTTRNRESSRSTARPTRRPGCPSPTSSRAPCAVLDVVRAALAADPADLRRLDRGEPPTSATRHSGRPGGAAPGRPDRVAGAAVTEPLDSALARLRGDDPRRRDARPRRRLGPAARHPSAVAARRAAVRRSQGRASPPAHGVRRRPGAHRQPCASATPARGRPRRAGRPSRTATGTSRPRPRPTSCGSPRRARRSCTRGLVPRRPSVDRDHDRDKGRLLPEDDPVFRALGLSDHAGRIKPSRQGKYRQVEEFLRILDASITDALAKGHLRRPTAEEPLQIVDLGCGNAYLTFVTERFLSHERGLPVHLTGIDQREQSRTHNEKLAGELGVDATFVAASIGDATLDVRPTSSSPCTPATRRPTTRSREPSAWETPLVLAAPCCHHDIAAQLRTHAHARAVRDAHPPRHPPRAVRRHPHRRPARPRCCGRGLPRRRDAVRRQSSTRRATRCCAASAPAGRRMTAPPGGSTTSWWRPGESGPGWASSSSRRDELAHAAAPGRSRRRRTVRAWASRPRRPRRPGTTVFAFSGPGDRRGERPAGPRRPVPHHQRLRSSRPGLRRGRVRRHGRGHALGRPPDRHRGARSGRERLRLGRRHRRQHQQPLVGRRSPGSLSGGVTATSTRRRTGSPTPTARPMPRPCCRTRSQVGSTSRRRTSSAACCTPYPRSWTRPGPNRLKALGRVLPVATDGAFFPDGQHVILRDYTSAVVYSWPSMQPVGRFELPPQRQGEGIGVAQDGTVYVSSEGPHAPVLEVTLPPPDRGRREGDRSRSARRHPRPVVPPGSTATRRTGHGLP